MNVQVFMPGQFANLLHSGLLGIAQNKKTLSTFSVWRSHCFFIYLILMDISLPIPPPVHATWSGYFLFPLLALLIFDLLKAIAPGAG
jgi:hypothetical protein